MKAPPFSQLLAGLWPQPPPGRLEVSWKPNDGRFRTRTFTIVKEASAHTSSIKGDVWYRVTAQHSDVKKRGKEHDSVALPALFADLDVKEGAFASVEAARSFVEELPLPPSALVASGGGLQVYWFLEEPLALTTDDERSAAKALLRGWEEFVRQRAGVRVDSVSDLARLLRVPGSNNCKTQPARPVKLLHCDAQVRYTREDFAKHAVPVDPQPISSSSNGGGGEYAFVLRADAEPPPLVLETLLSDDPKFRRSWDDQRDDLKDPTASGYDQSIASLAAHAGVTDPQVLADLMIARRRRHGEDLHLNNRSKYETTIRNALASANSAFTPGAETTISAPVRPTIADAAFHGPLAELVSIVGPHSEADPAALLVQALVAFGSVIGRGSDIDARPYFTVEGDRHYGNLFVALVGESSKARKGTSWGQVRRVFAAVDHEWSKERISSGLSSGEGLIWQVRDPIIPTSKKAQADEGVHDKRLLVFEGEFAQALKVMQRAGNTLSPVIRSAWESGDLRALTKNSPARATDAHISIIGHITRDELLRHLGETEAGNGFGNRFLWVLVGRSKCLPEGGALQKENLQPLVKKLKEAVQAAPSLMGRDEEARDLWAEVYPKLSEGKPGLLGAMIARAEAQVMRLALLYAVADGAKDIKRVHLEAALALWDYCDASARFIFGDAMGDPTADEILAALRRAPGGELTRAEISSTLFSRHKSSHEIGRALGALAQAGRVAVRNEGTGGRPREIWTYRA